MFVIGCVDSVNTNTKMSPSGKSSGINVRSKDLELCISFSNSHLFDSFFFVVVLVSPIIQVYTELNHKKCFSNEKKYLSIFIYHTFVIYKGNLFLYFSKCYFLKNM